MTDDAKAVALAKDILETQRSFDAYPDEVGDLARAFLALSERCEKLERVAEAAKSLCCLVKIEGNTAILPVAEVGQYQAKALMEALATLKPGDSDG